MENIDFVLWVVLWPLMIKTDTYLTAKINEIKKQPQHEDKNGDDSVVFIWIVVGLILFFN